MSSTDTLELLSRFLDGDVDEPERVRAESLLQEDAEARRLYEGLARVRGRLADLPEVTAPAHLGALVQQRLAVEADEVTVWGRLDRQLRRWLLDPSFLPAFAVLLALAAMIYALSFGIARFERDSGPVILSAPEAVTAPEGRAPARSRALASREFVRRGELWVEAGLVPAAPDLPVLSGAELEEWLTGHRELAALEPLGVVIVEVEGAAIGLDFTAGEGD